MLTKNEIVKLLETNDKAIARALIVLYNNQTKIEQMSQTTINRNGEGFRPCHSRMGCSMAEFYQKRGFLSPKQIAYWRVKDKNGDMRLAIYWRQLAEAAEAKKATQAAKPAEPVSEVQTCPDEIEMHRMEAEGDRLQTQKEEWLKHIRKNKLEGHA
jgi:hypothetical protein